MLDYEYLSNRKDALQFLAQIFQPKTPRVQGRLTPAQEYLVDGIADAQQALSEPLLSSAILLHQTQQHRTAGVTDALFLVVVHLGQMDFELGIGPVSGWKSPEGGGSPHGGGGEETGKNKMKGKNLDHPKDSNNLGKFCLVSCLGKFSLQGGQAFSSSSQPHPHTRRHIP